MVQALFRSCNKYGNQLIRKSISQRSQKVSVTSEISETDSFSLSSSLFVRALSTCQILNFQNKIQPPSKIPLDKINTEKNSNDDINFLNEIQIESLQNRKNDQFQQKNQIYRLSDKPDGDEEEDDEEDDDDDLDQALEDYAEIDDEDDDDEDEEEYEHEDDKALDEFSKSQT